MSFQDKASVCFSHITPSSETIDFGFRKFFADPIAIGGASLVIGLVSTVAGYAINPVGCLVFGLSATLLDNAASWLAEKVVKVLKFEHMAEVKASLSLAFRVAAVIGAFFALSAACPHLMIPFVVAIGLYAGIHLLKALFTGGFLKLLGCMSGHEGYDLERFEKQKLSFVSK